jgi:hypothetical protein
LPLQLELSEQLMIRLPQLEVFRFIADKILQVAMFP